MAATLPDYLQTFEAWLYAQQLEGADMPDEVRAALHAEYERRRCAMLARDVQATVRAPHRHGHPRYAVAIEDDANLWLTLWIKRSPDGECFVLWPRGRGKWNPHASYHRDGRYHQKSHGVASMVRHLQPLDQFQGREHLGWFFGHGPGVAVCAPEAFTSVIRVPAGILDGTYGAVCVDLVEPGHAPAAHHREVPGMRILSEHIFRDCSPWVVIAVAEQAARER